MAANPVTVRDSVSVLSAAWVGLSQSSEHRHYSIARKFAAMRARIAETVAVGSYDRQEKAPSSLKGRGLRLTE
jgi:hypothetical protein